MAFRQVARSALVRVWPYLSGTVICLLLGLADRQTRQAVLFGEGVPISDWLGTRLAGPWQQALHDPVGGWPAWLLLALLPLHLIWPRWWLAPLAMGPMIAWCFWGSQLVGRLA